MSVLRPPFDVEIAHQLDTRDDYVTSMLPEQIETLRAGATPPSAEEVTLGSAFELSEHEVPGHRGDGIRMLVLTPSGATDPSPLLYHVHGGGLVLGTPYDDVPSLAALAAEHGCAVASVDYRLAPEHRYPTAVEDVYAGLLWLAEHGGDLGIDTERIILTGMSAGGGLAAAAALLARDRRGPALIGQMLLCPMLDHRNDSESAVQMAGLGTWDRTANATAWAAYLGDEPGEVPPYASPSVAVDLSGLPPAFIDVASAETFRSEDVDYARKLWSHGGDAELHVWPGGVHGFDGFAPASALAAGARSARSQWLARVLGRAAG